MVRPVPPAIPITAVAATTPAPTAAATTAAGGAVAATTSSAQHGDQRSFWGLCGHCCGILQYSGGFSIQDHHMSRRFMDRVDHLIRVRSIP